MTLKSRLRPALLLLVVTRGGGAGQTIYACGGLTLSGEFARHWSS